MRNIKQANLLLLCLLIVSLYSLVFICSACSKQEVKTNNNKSSSVSFSEKDSSDIFFSSKDKKKKTYTNCDLRALLRKNNVSKIESGEYYLDFEKNLVYSPHNRIRDVKIESKCYEGSFTGVNRKEVLILVEIKGDFCMAEGGGLNSILIFDKSDYLVKNYGLRGGNGDKIDFVGDVDNDGISEIFSGGWGHGAGKLSTGVSIYYGELDKSIFYRPEYYHGDKLYSYESEYMIKGNEVIFDLRIDFFEKNKYDKPLRTENYRDVFAVSNGKVKHKEGNIEDIDKYLKQYDK